MERNFFKVGSGLLARKSIGNEQEAQIAKTKARQG